MNDLQKAALELSEEWSRVLDAHIGRIVELHGLTLDECKDRVCIVEQSMAPILTEQEEDCVFRRAWIEVDTVPQPGTVVMRFNARNYVFTVSVE